MENCGGPLDPLKVLVDGVLEMPPGRRAQLVKNVVWEWGVFVVG